MSRAGEIWQGTIKRWCPFRAQLESTYGIPLDQGPPKLPEAQIRDQDGKGAILGAEKLQKLINKNERGKNIFILIWRDISGKNISAGRLSTREWREESERTTGAIGLHVKQESHHLNHTPLSERLERANIVRV